MQFTHIIIQNIYKTGTFVVEFLRYYRRGNSSSVQAGLKATLMDPVNIEDLEEDEGLEQ
jgi:hypothetical protein